MTYLIKLIFILIIALMHQQRLKAGADIRHGLFGAGIESSHALERTHIESIDATQNLLYAYCLSPINL